MTPDVDSSALLKRCVDEHDSQQAVAHTVSAVLTFDARQAQAARRVGLAVVGA